MVAQRGGAQTSTPANSDTDLALSAISLGISSIDSQEVEGGLWLEAHDSMNDGDDENDDDVLDFEFQVEGQGQGQGQDQDEDQDQEEQTDSDEENTYAAAGAIGDTSAAGGGAAVKAAFSPTSSAATYGSAAEEGASPFQSACATTLAWATSAAAAAAAAVPPKESKKRKFATTPGEKIKRSKARPALRHVGNTVPTNTRLLAGGDARNAKGKRERNLKQKCIAGGEAALQMLANELATLDESFELLEEIC